MTRSLQPLPSPGLSLFIWGRPSLHLQILFPNKNMSGFCMPRCTWWWTNPVYAQIGCPGGSRSPHRPSRCPFVSLLSVFPAWAWCLRRGGQGGSLHRGQLCRAVGVSGCSVAIGCPFPGTCLLACFSGWRQQKRSFKLEMTADLEEGRLGWGAAEPLWTGFWRSPRCQAGRCWLTEGPSEEPAVVRSWRAQLGAAGVGRGVGRAASGDGHVGKRPSVGRC